MTAKERVTAVLKGERPDRLPFVDRIELWHRRHENSDTMPQPYRGMSLNEIHREIGMGRQ